MAPAYKILELAPDHIKAESHYAMLECYEEIGISDTVCLDSSAFLSVVDSMPRQHEVELSITPNTLSWKCGPAKGRLATMSPPELSRLPVIQTEILPTSKALATALDRASISSDNAALGAIGLYGVLLSNQDQFTAASTDNFTISYYELNHIPGFPQEITLPTLGAELLSTIIDDDGGMQIDTTSRYNGILYHRSDRLSCRVLGVPKLSTDVMEIIDSYREDYGASQLPKDRLQAFIQRAHSLSDNRRYAKVIMGAHEGRITLSFEENTASTEEYIIAEDLKLPPGEDIAPIALPAMKIARALSHADKIVLGYIDRNIIIFRGGPFSYIISGTAVK
jgi:DNA polymerase III sliding clamp (beta) subunit (PCNA family)